ncbi:TolC family outer membrane protein [Bradyrhizobium canariense]|uniref:TolC family outer membrane protein n=1 Tax=Bradyrhizobium canariense TaxID=255045 RepID=UPI001CA5B587|nr:TolC family outer membrane protein [Bradyrhizobium canariense]MBW5434117.1 TolC family outer membrane protein [Bradyrhizobium canariense]
MHGVKFFTGAAVSVLLLALAGPTPASADTIEAALVRAYQNNPQLNAQRAQVRSTDENVPQALSGYRPKVNVTLGSGYQYQDVQATQNVVPPTPKSISGLLQPNSASVSVSQTLYNGNQTANRTRVAESQVSGSREALRVLEQTVLLQAATAYMDFLRDSATLEVQRSNVRVLEQTLKQTRDRFNVGEVTRTDVAQSEAQLAAGRTQALTAESNLTTTRANFRRIIGNEPAALAPGSPVDRFLPATIASAVGLSLVENPNVTAAMYGIDVNYLQVKINEGALLPTVTVAATASTAYQQQLTIFRTSSASALATVAVPIYQGGTEYALIRQSKENLAQQRLNLETTRDQTRANVVQAWGQLEAGKAQVQSAQAQVTASEIALNGVREEAKAGQRTTLDVLNAQQALVNARVALVTAQHDRVVASYSVLNAVGRLAPQVLGLNTTVYDPSVHYQQVRDSWAGVRTPDGR